MSIIIFLVKNKRQSWRIILMKWYFKKYLLTKFNKKRCWDEVINGDWKEWKKEIINEMSMKKEKMEVNRNFDLQFFWEY